MATAVMIGMAQDAQTPNTEIQRNPGATNGKKGHQISRSCYLISSRKHQLIRGRKGQHQRLLQVKLSLPCFFHLHDCLVTVWSHLSATNSPQDIPRLILWSWDITSSHLYTFTTFASCSLFNASLYHMILFITRIMSFLLICSLACINTMNSECTQARQLTLHCTT